MKNYPKCFIDFISGKKAKDFASSFSHKRPEPKTERPPVRGLDELKKRFTYHPPKDDQPKKYEEIRDTAHAFARLIDEHCPDSREKSLALTKLEEAVFWANASIARNE